MQDFHEEERKNVWTGSNNNFNMNRQHCVGDRMAAEGDYHSLLSYARQSSSALDRTK